MCFCLIIIIIYIIILSFFFFFFLTFVLIFLKTSTLKYFWTLILSKQWTKRYRKENSQLQSGVENEVAFIYQKSIQIFAFDLTALHSIDKYILFFLLLKLDIISTAFTWYDTCYKPFWLITCALFYFWLIITCFYLLDPFDQCNRESSIHFLFFIFLLLSSIVRL